MRKWLTIMAFVLMLALPLLAFGQTTTAPTTATEAAKSAFSPFEVFMGAGQVAVGRSGSASAYAIDFQTNLSLGFRWFPTSRFAVEAKYTHDTVSIGYWLARHQFLEPRQGIQAYQYSLLSVSAEYWPIKNDRGGMFVFAGPVLFHASGVDGYKGGVTAGVGAQYVIIGPFFLQTEAEFMHFSGILGLEEANTYNTSVHVGLRF